MPCTVNLWRSRMWRKEIPPEEWIIYWVLLPMGLGVTLAKLVRMMLPI